MPGGMILPGYVLGGIVLIGMLIISLILTEIAKLIFKLSSFSTLFVILTSIIFIVLHYNWYSPHLKIIVPKKYTGQITLVLSKVDKNILTVDSNGIGYITKWTFDKTYSPPIVIDKNGKEMDELCIWFNPTTFWAKGTTSSTHYTGEIKYLSFQIKPKDTAGQNKIGV
jgi:hypothetical protein